MNRNKKNIPWRRTAVVAASLALVLGLAGCSSTSSKTTASAKTTTEASSSTSNSSSSSDSSTASSSDSSSSKDSTVNSDGTINTDNLFSDRDLEQTADTSNATKYTVSDGEDISITKEGVYVISGSATDVTITVDADDAKVQIVLNGVSITNTDSPAIYVKSADKVFVTTVKDTENTLKVTGTFTADGETNTDAVIFSKDDLTLNGEGTLTISSTANGVSSKDDLTITGGTYKIKATKDAFEAHDSIAIKDGTFDLTCKNGIKAEDKDDTSVGWIAIEGGTFTIDASN